MPGLTSIGLAGVGGRRAAPVPFVLVIFGASGDLTRRKLLPAVYGLYCDKLLPEKSIILGFARSEMSEEAFREELRQAVKSFTRTHPFDEDLWAKFATRIQYQQGNYQNAEDFIRLRRRLEELTSRNQMAGNYLFYLSTPPTEFIPVVRNLGTAGLSCPSAPTRSWVRIVVEKPFGRDLASAGELNQELLKVFSESQVFRIDHYLGKETVQNLLVLRFANSLFEPLWNQKYVDHVQITVAETLGVGSRGKYYDQAGALRDMVQNHMMNLLCLIAIEPPVSLDADALRNEKVKLLKALRPIPPECASFGVVRAQYTAGAINGKPAPAYQQEKGVNPDSQTETYVAFKAFVDNWRWSGVPFYLRTGKRLPEQVTEISIHFKPVPQVLFNAAPYGPMQPNVLSVRIQPDEGISFQFQVKTPGPIMQIRPFHMDFSYADAFEHAPPDAYERLLLDAALADSTLFIRGDEIEAAWAFVSPILQGCDISGGRQLATYPAGTWGPKEADRLISGDGNRWHITPRSPRKEPALKTPLSAQR